jgi:hypothetical protein
MRFLPFALSNYGNAVVAVVALVAAPGSTAHRT